MRFLPIAPATTRPATITVLSIGLMAMAGCVSSAEPERSLPPRPSDATAVAGGIRPLSQGLDDNGPGPAVGQQQGSPSRVDRPVASNGGGAGGGGGDRACNADAALGLIGERSDPSMAERARAATGTSQVRVIGPNDFVTQDYAPARLNIDVNSDGVVTAVRCG